MITGKYHNRGGEDCTARIEPDFFELKVRATEMEVFCIVTLHFGSEHFYLLPKLILNNIILTQVEDQQKDQHIKLFH